MHHVVHSITLYSNVFFIGRLLYILKEKYNNLFKNTYISLSLCLDFYINIICICMCMCMYMYICVCVCMYLYIYTPFV